MKQNQSPEKGTRQYTMNMVIAGVTGLVGLLTLVIVLGAVLGGLWLDNIYQTKPTFTIILVIASIPISLVVMFLVVRASVKRIKIDTKPGKPEQKEEVPNLGRREED